MKFTDLRNSVRLSLSHKAFEDSPSCLLRLRLARQPAWSKWSGLVAERDPYGQSVAAFYLERSLCTSHFFFWKERLGLQRIAELPSYPQQALRTTRMRELFLVDLAFILARLEIYAKAESVATGPAQASMRRAVSDPEDLRALGNMPFSLDRQA